MKIDPAVAAAIEAIRDIEHVSGYRANRYQIARAAVEAARPVIEGELMEKANLVTIEVRKLREALEEANGR